MDIAHFKFLSQKYVYKFEICTSAKNSIYDKKLISLPFKFTMTKIRIRHYCSIFPTKLVD